MTDVHLEATVSLRGVVSAPCGDVLVVQRASDGGWELPGGRLAPDEDVAVILTGSGYKYGTPGDDDPEVGEIDRTDVPDAVRSLVG